jgi:phage-related protein
MPGSVENAAPTTVLPASLCRSFARQQEVPVLVNEYPDGNSNRKALTANSRKRWRLSKRLTPTQLATLRTFYEDRKGGHEAFYFYDPWETSSRFASDPTGISPVGRYVVRFDGAFSQAIGIGRADAEIALIEIA